MIDDNEQLIAVAGLGEDSEDLPAPVTEPPEAEALPMDANSIQALTQRVSSISIAKELQAEKLAKDKQREQELATRVARTKIANEAHAKFVADPSDANCEVLRSALRTLAIGVLIPMHIDWKPSELAADHCLKQVQRGMYKPDPSARFATWAATVMRNKIRDSMRKTWRAQKRRARKEAKLDAQAYERYARIMRKYKRLPPFEFTREEVKAAAIQLRAKQTQLLELKACGVSNRKIAKKLNLTLSQLYNRWARLRKRVKQILKPKRTWLNSPSPIRRWYPGAETYKPLAKANIKR